MPIIGHTLSNIGHIGHVNWILSFRLSVTALRQSCWCIYLLSDMEKVKTIAWTQFWSKTFSTEIWTEKMHWNALKCTEICTLCACTAQKLAQLQKISMDTSATSTTFPMYVYSESWYIAIFVQKCPLSDTFCPILDILDMWIGFFSFRFSITELEQSFWCVIHVVYKIWELKYRYICPKIPIIGNILSNIGHIGHVNLILSVRLSITALRQSFWCIMHGVYLICELIYSYICPKMSIIGHILFNIGHIWHVNCIFFFHIINQCIDTVILMHNTWGLCNGKQNWADLLSA